MSVAPLDYAVDDDGGDAVLLASTASDASVTLATVLERHASAAPVHEAVTEAMFRDAWRRMESGHGPGVDSPGASGRVSLGADASAMARGMLGRTLRRFRPSA